MSNNLDLSNITALTNQINTLKQQAAATNTGANAGNETEINNTLLSLQQNFSQMLNDLVSVSNDDNNNSDQDNSNPFAFLTQSNQAVASASSQTVTGTTTAAATNTNAAQTVDPNIMATQYKLNVENIF